MLYSTIGPAGVLRGISAGNGGAGNTKPAPAGQGWKTFTGWGSPDGVKLLDALQTSDEKRE